MFQYFFIPSIFPYLPLFPIGRIPGSVLSVALMVVFNILTLDEAVKSMDPLFFCILFGIMFLTIYLEKAKLFKYLGNFLLYKCSSVAFYM
ncbi:hypothetical protein HanXRQr2_Chr02g0066011 [Helianthus annuus]|uniref:Uncharacterized protein n=1 Tax=Helianthus annuus TaxID=4232 RepID=A0A9K3JMM6_HELAN|nr:hypothetical protein HanXRQr2_Chr02g0066011 [Helianthus annuus]KAJ0951831.1 hypothetical protein HanPSC8_Chr02g0064991 [Helianthus annuus]